MKDVLGIIGGTGFLKGAELTDAEVRTVPTQRGDVLLHVAPGIGYLCRHGRGVYHPPHRIPHHAHVLAFESIHAVGVVGINSVGSLSPEVPPGTVVVADDYFTLQPPATFVENERHHVVPELSGDLRELLLTAARSTEGPVKDGGTYVQTTGPRFETPAEVRFYRDYGEIIGMTAAAEATLFRERGIPYAMIGLVDNLANGLGVAPLTFDSYERQVAKNDARAKAILSEIIRLHRATL